jgi:microcystin-dependent protein
MQTTPINNLKKPESSDNYNIADFNFNFDIIDKMLIHAGAILYYARNTAPSGYLKANGAAISRTTYADLFSAIGTTYGVGDGSTTFNIPDGRGVFPRGLDDGKGYDTGRTLGSYQADTVKNHVHPVTVTGANHGHDESQGTGSAGGGYYGKSTFGGGTSTLSGQIGASGTLTMTGTTDNNTSGTTENLVKNIAWLCCIKY